MIVSFAWTTPAAALGEKHETRRVWSSRTAITARNAMAKGDLVECYTKSPQYGGELFGHARIKNVAIERTSDAPDASFGAEGFHVLDLLGVKIDGRFPMDLWEYWHIEQIPIYTVTFEIEGLTELGHEIANDAKGALAGYNLDEIPRSYIAYKKWVESLAGR